MSAFIGNQNDAKASLAGVFFYSSQPAAREFELEAGIEGIAGAYRFPFDLSATEFGCCFTLALEKHAPPQKQGEDCCPSCDLGESCPDELGDALSDLWSELVNLNPCLTRICLETGNARQTVHAILGVASGYPVRDINFFLAIHRKAGGSGVAVFAMDNIPSLQTLNRDVYRASGWDVPWLASPRTLRDILARFSPAAKNRIF